MNVVIIGLGYVGLPLAQEAVRVGLNVTGFDVKITATTGNIEDADCDVDVR